MGWFRLRRDPRNTCDDPDYCVAEEKVEDLERRARRVVPQLIARRNRNHWGEAIAAIARGDIT